MEDLPARLRVRTVSQVGTHNLMCEAADEIEHLRSLLIDLRTVLDDAQVHGDDYTAELARIRIALGEVS